MVGPPAPAVRPVSVFPGWGVPGVGAARTGDGRSVPCPVCLPVVGCPVGHGSVEQFLLSVVVSGLVGFVPDVVDVVSGEVVSVVAVPDGVAHRDCGLVFSLDWFGSLEPFDSSVLVDFGEFALGAVREVGLSGLPCEYRVAAVGLATSVRVPVGDGGFLFLGACIKPPNSI